MTRSATAAAPDDAYAIDRSSVAWYFLVGQTLLIILAGVWFLGLGLIVGVLYLFTLGPWLTSKQADALRYWRDGKTLRVDQGVFFLKRKAIPLERITDVVLTQGPLMRWGGLWALQVQTAGAGGQAMPEATLYGLVDAEAIRDELLAERFGQAGAERP